MLVTEKSTPFFAKNEAGGKGYNLYLMSAANLPVPSWVTFGKRFYAEFIQTHQLAPQLESILQNFLRCHHIVYILCSIEFISVNQ